MIICNSDHFLEMSISENSNEPRKGEQRYSKQACIYLCSPFAHFGLLLFSRGWHGNWSVQDWCGWMQKRQSKKHKRPCTRKSCCKCLGKAHTPFLHAWDVALIAALWIRQNPTKRPLPCLARMSGETGERLNLYATLLCGGVVHSLTACTPCRLPGTDTNSRGCGGHRGHPKPLATTEAHPRIHTLNSATAMQHPRPACASTLATIGCS